MATQADVRRIALGFPGAEEEPGRFAFGVRQRDGKLKGFAWVWLERLDPKKARVPQPKVLAVRTASLDDKEFLLSPSTEKFFTEPHYNGYPAVMVQLAAVKVAELRVLLEEAWRVVAPKVPAAKPAARKAPTRSPKGKKSSTPRRTRER
ncbi:MAG: hypothetical protein IPK12_24625 [Gemmatimonadetes bacterium]|nr:hypothetical protein [Gemmatimonadota bacterium]